MPTFRQPPSPLGPKVEYVRTPGRPHAVPGPDGEAPVAVVAVLRVRVPLPGRLGGAGGGRGLPEQGGAAGPGDGPGGRVLGQFQ